MTTVPPLWPSTLPQVALLDGYGETFPDTIYRSPMEFGPAKSRRRTSAGIRHISWPIILTSAQLDILYDFYNDTLLGGNIPFEHYHPRNNEGLERNLLLNSEDFEAVGWLTFATVVNPAATTAPDGLLTGTKLTETNVESQQMIWRYAEMFDDNEVVTWSIHVNESDRDLCRLMMRNKADVWPDAYFDLSDGTVYTQNNCTAGIVAETGGWYRVWQTCDIGSGPYTPSIYCAIEKITNWPWVVGGVREYTGTPDEGLYIWGAQLERGSLTDYKQTIGAPTPGFYMRFVEPPVFAPRGLQYHGVMELEVLP